MDPGKVSAVKSWPTPTTLKEVSAFIGFANFYRRFIKDFSTMARPLHDLTKKDTPWQWNKEQQEAFDSIKRQFCTDVRRFLLMPDLGRCGEVGDEKRSDSLDNFPRVVGARGRKEKGASGEEMNLGLIEEHQAGSLGSAQYNYLYISLEATLAYVIVPIAKVPRT